METRACSRWCNRFGGNIRLFPFIFVTVHHSVFPSLSLAPPPWIPCLFSLFYFQFLIYLLRDYYYYYFCSHLLSHSHVHCYLLPSSSFFFFFVSSSLLSRNFQLQRSWSPFVFSFHYSREDRQTKAETYQAERWTDGYVGRMFEK